MFTYKQIARVAGEPRLLFTGGNGHKTYGVHVPALEDGSAQGFKNEWDNNDSQFLGSPEQVKGKLGLNDAEYDRIAAALRDLEEKQI